MRYSLKLLLVVLLTLPVSILVAFFGLFDSRGERVYRLARFWTWGVLKIAGVRLKTRGLARLDPGRPYIFMANHQSNLDIPVLVQSLPKFQLRWIAKKELFFIPFFGWALWSSKHIIVDRSSRQRAVMGFSQAKERIAQGISVVFFPEGTRSVGGELMPFKKGGFLLAVKTQTPIVPITINGSGNILPKGDWRIRQGEIEVIVSEPVFVNDFRARDVPSLMNEIRRIITVNSGRNIEIPEGESAQMQSPATTRTLS